MVLVKSRCCVVLGIHHHGIGGNLGTYRAVERIRQHRATQALALECLIHRQTPHADGGHRGVARQLLACVFGQISQPQAGRSQGVVGRNAIGAIQGHKAGRHAAPDIL